VQASILEAFDLTLARRLVLQCESSAASGKAWALILSRRLQDPKPISDSALSVASRICDEIELAGAICRTPLAVSRTSLTSSKSHN
jgi:hypothetical protein